MSSVRDVYGNSKRSGYTIDFFSLMAPRASSAFLACPFFSTFDPIKLLTERGCNVRLIVRLCSITPPPVLQQALADPLVSVRYYTSRDFHAKLYIIDDRALIGSANLTKAGLNTNREVSVVLQKDRDPSFDELPGLFNWFWDYADVFNREVLDAYKLAFRTIGAPREEDEFERALGKHVPLVAPPNAKVGSEIISKRRSFLQSFRRKYDERLLPAYAEVGEYFAADGRRRPEYASGNVEIELNRFLGWSRIVHAPGETWRQSPLADRSGRAARITALLDDWFSRPTTAAGDMIYEDREVQQIEALQRNFATADSINALSYDELFDTLTSCHAFLELLRFVAGGLDGVRREFGERNSLAEIKRTLVYLLHGDGSILERAYDCIYNESYKLYLFGESCVMELVGWLDPTRPPINGRTIKALRFFGFDVSD